MLQGYLEASNVNPVREMVEMIAVQRAYEASQKMISAQDETLAKAVNDLGRA
ncbi:Flagellar basal-body rod protein FlgG [compost metagenome]